MNIVIKYPLVNNPPPPAPVGNYRVLKHWNQLTGVDTEAYNAGGLDQFEFYRPYITDAAGNWCGDWSSNNNWSYLTHDDVMRLAAMQIADEQFSVHQKMSYLTAWGDRWGNPLRVPTDPTTGVPYPWDIAPVIKMIGAFYGGQVVDVLGRANILVDFGGVKEVTPMVEVRAFSRADWGTTHATHPHLVHIMTGVNKSNEPRDRVKGIVYLPVSLGSDFTFRGGFKPAHWRLMERWLV